MTQRIIPALVSALIAATAFAGWEDTIPASQPRGANTTTAQTRQAPVSAKPSRGAPLYQNGAPAGAQNPARMRTSAPQPQPPRPAPRPAETAPVIPDDLYSAFLDAPAPTEIWGRATYAAKGDVEGAGNGFGIFEIDGRWDALEFRNVLYGDITLALTPSLRILTDDANIKYMPSALMALPVDATWIWRYLNGWSLEIGATPGIYADVEALFLARAISLPFRACLYYNFSDETAVRFGGIVRPNWNQTFMPIIGVAWKPSEMFRMEVGVPETLAQARFGLFSIYGRLDWLNTTYAIKDKANCPERITFNDWRAGVGVTFDITDSLSIACETGVLAGRDISFDGGPYDFEADVDSVSYFSVLIGSEF